MFTSLSTKNRTAHSPSLFRTSSDESLSSVFKTSHYSTSLFNPSNSFTSSSSPASNNPVSNNSPAPASSLYSVDSFLSLIGKDCAQYASKFSSFEQLLSMKSEQMKKLGIPTKQRKWILMWAERCKMGLPIYTITKKNRASK